MINNSYDSQPIRIPPGLGQESVWDYPRQPRLETAHHHLKILFNGQVIAETILGLRLLVISHPPVYYFPPAAVRLDVITMAPKNTFCEWKGQARYWTVTVGGRSALFAAWSYPNPFSPYEALRDYLAFYARPMDACLIDGELVEPQPGDFYGGWITSKIVGPYKGGPGTFGW